MKDNVKLCGQRLRRLRAAAGLSQESLAAKCGVHAISINYLEQGRREPKPATLAALAKGLGVSADLLLRREGPETGAPAKPECFGQRPRQLRKAAGWSQEDLALKCGVNPNTISSLELGQRDPQPATIAMLAKALGISVTELLNPLNFPAPN